MNTQILTMLLLPTQFEYLNNQPHSDSISAGHCCYIRFYCKSLGIDEDLSLVFDTQLDNRQLDELSEQFSHHHFLEEISQQKAWLKVRNKQIQSVKKQDLSISLIWMNQPVRFGLSFKQIVQICRVLDITEIPPCDMLRAIELIQKNVYYKALKPPFDLIDHIFSLDDAGLQALIPGLLAHNVVSLDMLASFILEMDHDQQVRMLSNSSRAIRSRLEQKMTQQKQDYSLSWKKISLYMLQGNLIPLTGKNIIPELRIYSCIQRIFMINRLQMEERQFILKQTISTLSSQNKIERLFSDCKTQYIIAADILFPGIGLSSLFAAIFSDRAVQLFTEDKDYLQSAETVALNTAALSFVHLVYLSYFEDRLNDYDVHQQMQTLVRHPSSLDILVRICGIPCFLTVIEDMEVQWIDSFVKGTLAILYKQWKTKKISLNHMEKWDKKKCQSRFLLELLLMAHEGRI